MHDHCCCSVHCDRVFSYKVEFISIPQLNVNQATREYLERYVAKKKEREKFLQQQAAEMEKDEELAPGVDSIEAPKPPLLFGKDDGVDKEFGSEEDAKKFGLVSAADTQADELAIQKMNGMLEERYWTRSHVLLNVLWK